MWGHAAVFHHGFGVFAAVVVVFGFSWRMVFLWENDARFSVWAEASPPGRVRPDNCFLSGSGQSGRREPQQPSRPGPTAQAVLWHSYCVWLTCKFHDNHPTQTQGTDTEVAQNIYLAKRMPSLAYKTSKGSKEQLSTSPPPNAVHIALNSFIQVQVNYNALHMVKTDNLSSLTVVSSP